MKPLGRRITRYRWEEQRLEAIGKIPAGRYKPTQEKLAKMIRNHRRVSKY